MEAENPDLGKAELAVHTETVFLSCRLRGVSLGTSFPISSSLHGMKRCLGAGCQGDGSGTVTTYFCDLGKVHGPLCLSQKEEMREFGASWGFQQAGTLRESL